MLGRLTNGFRELPADYISCTSKDRPLATLHSLAALPALAKR